MILLPAARLFLWVFVPPLFCLLISVHSIGRGLPGKRAMASLWTGSLASVFALVFLHEKEAASMGICRMLFGRDVLIETYPFPVIDPILFALPLLGTGFGRGQLAYCTAVNGLFTRDASERSGYVAWFHLSASDCRCVRLSARLSARRCRVPHCCSFCARENLRSVI